MIKLLEGKGILLRPLEKLDLADLNEWRNDYSIFKNLGGGFQPLSIDQQALWMDNMIDLTSNNKRFMITKNNNSIGVVGLYNINYINRNCEFGIYIGNKSYHGKGIGKEATLLMINYAFQNLNMRKVKLLVNDDNFAHKMYEKLGFRNVGFYENERYVNGKYLNVYIMELLYEQFKGV